MHTATLLPDGRVLVSGGVNYPASLKTAEVYDPHTHTWTSVASMAEEREQHGAMLLASGRVIVCGGGSGISWHTAEEYDPVANAWIKIANMNTGRQRPTITFLSVSPDGPLLINGGRNDSGFPDQIYTP